MNWMHVHLALNHVPVLGPAFVAVFYVAALVAKHRGAQRFCLWVLVALAAVSVPIKYTGDFAMEEAALQTDMDPRYVNAHGETADQATTGAFLLGIAAAAALVAGRGGRAVPKWAHALVLVLTAATFLLMVRAANSGGLIRHPEVRTEPRKELPGVRNE
jgi:hypothetical protein